MASHTAVNLLLLYFFLSGRAVHTYVAIKGVYVIYFNSRNLSELFYLFSPITTDLYLKLCDCKRYSNCSELSLQFKYNGQPF